MLNEVADATIIAIEDLKENVDAAVLRRAAEMLDSANTIHVAGYRQASWIAAYLFYDLTRLGCRCYRLDSPDGAAQRNVSVLGAGDLLLAVCFSDDDDSAVRVAAAASAHSTEHPLAGVSRRARFRYSPSRIRPSTPWPVSQTSSSRCRPPARRFQPWAARMMFAQALVFALEKRRAGRL